MNLSGLRLATTAALGGTSGMRLHLTTFKHAKSHGALAAAAALLLLGLALGGCNMSPDVAASVTIADGTKVNVPVGAAANAPVDDGTVFIEVLQFAPWDMGKDKPRAVVFNFVIKFEKGAAPTSVKVEDVTEDPIEEIYNDEHAHLMKKNIWGGTTRPFAPQDEHVKWILTLDNNIRIYRFTVKLADGTTHQLMKPVMVPAFMKDFIRTQLGLKV